MSLNFNQIKERVADQFADMHQMGDSIIRFTKKADQEPYAVCYLDFTNDLPGTQEKLDKYQDSVIGQYYFDGRPSLQWSNYLYFIISKELLAKSEMQHAKGLIESDRSYARKFVITEKELDSILSPRPVVTPDKAPNASIHSIWTDRLVNAGIDGAILSDKTMPARIELIVNKTIEPKHKLQPTRQKLSGKAAPFIKSIEVITYRNFLEKQIGRAHV